MKNLDPRLRQLARQDSFTKFSMMERVGISPKREFDSPLNVEALMRCRDRAVVDKLVQYGVDIRFVSEGVYTSVSATVPVEVLSSLSEMEGVQRIDASREMVSELNFSRHETGADQVHALRPPVRGSGALVAIVDDGIDYTHPDFRNADGSPRILYLWDQDPSLSGSTGVPYGREHTKRDLDAALKSHHLVHRDNRSHGTHATGIAGGNGAQNPLFSGIAPEADLIFVALYTDGQVSWARSVPAFDAFSYVASRAQELGLPVAINISQGLNGGGHSGETALEVALDGLARKPGVAIIKSAGNEQESHIHAGGQIATGQTIVLDIVVTGNYVLNDVLELWYDGADAISVALQPPGSVPFSFVAPGDQEEFETLASNHVAIESDLDADDTGDTMATILISHGNAPFVQPGTWKLWLRGDRIKSGRYDVWIENTKRKVMGRQTRFTPASADDTRTTTIPGTARNVITVGAYVTRVTPSCSLQLGQVASFSSCGPTRYGVRKPDISAPGDIVVSTRSSQGRTPSNPSQWYTPMAGTSMAAPHVTAAAALVLSLRPTLNSDQVRQILTTTARCDGLAACAPDDHWGSGKLDVEAVIERTRTAHFPIISHATVSGTEVSWRTDIPTTGALRFHTHQRQLQLGKNLGSRTDLMLSTQHTLSLSGLQSGTYYCEILAYSKDNLMTVDDQNGAFHLVDVP